MQQETCDLAVVGGGAAGLTAAEVAATLGLRVALIEADRIGGECTWTGCVPSKALIAAARQAWQAHHAHRFGITVSDVRVDFPAVMQYVRQTRQAIHDDKDADTLRSHGIIVYQAFARFEDAHHLLLDDRIRLRAKYILLATGAPARIPAGFDDVPYLTHTTLFDLTGQPDHLLIVGGGPVGTEMAQAFNRLGTTVTLVTAADRLLPRDDREASELIMRCLRDEGVTIHTGIRATGASGTTGDIQLHLSGNSTLSGTHLLIAAGKQPDIRGMNPHTAGIRLDAHGAPVIDRTLRTSQPHIYVAGDVAGGAQFTHAAGSMASNALINMLSPYRVRGMKPFYPAATFTDPEVAQAGMTEADARRRYKQAQVTRLPITRSDRARVDGEQHGFMKLVHLPGGKLLGATIVGGSAAEMMNEWSRILERGGRVWDAVLPVHIYPTMGESSAILATEQLRQQVATTRFGRLVKRLAGWRIGSR